MLLLLALLAGCGGGVYKKPEVTLQSVQLGGLGLQGGTLLVKLGIVNPNRFALNANELRYSLMIGDPDEESDTTWVDFASGVHEGGFSVPAGDTASVEVPVEFSYAGLGGAAGSLLRAGTFDYRARGSVDVRTPLGTYEVPFEKVGTVTLMNVR